MDGHLFAGVDFPQINIDSQPMYLSDLQKAAQIFHINVPSQVSDAVVFQYKAYSGNLTELKLNCDILCKHYRIEFAYFL